MLESCKLLSLSLSFTSISFIVAIRVDIISIYQIDASLSISHSERKRCQRSGVKQIYELACLVIGIQKLSLALYLNRETPISTLAPFLSSSLLARATLVELAIRSALSQPSHRRNFITSNKRCSGEAALEKKGETERLIDFDGSSAAPRGDHTYSCQPTSCQLPARFYDYSCPSVADETFTRHKRPAPQIYPPPVVVSDNSIHSSLFVPLYHLSLPARFSPRDLFVFACPAAKKREGNFKRRGA